MKTSQLMLCFPPPTSSFGSTPIFESTGWATAAAAIMQVLYGKPLENFQSSQWDGIRCYFATKLSKIEFQVMTVAVIPPL